MLITPQGRGIVYDQGKRYILPIYTNKNGYFLTKLKGHYLFIDTVAKAKYTKRDVEAYKNHYKIFKTKELEV